MIANPLLLSLLRYKYVALFLAAIPEGPLLAVLSGFMLRTAALTLFPAYVALMLGNIVPDIVCYHIGRFGSKHDLVAKYGTKYPIIGKHFATVEKLWHGHFRKTVVLSKLSYGLSTPFLMSAGLLHVPFRRYITYTVMVDFIAIGTFLALGYLFGEAYRAIAAYIDKAGIAVAFVLVFVFFFAFRLVTKRASAELVKLAN